MMDATVSDLSRDAESRNAESAMSFLLTQLVYPLVDHPDRCTVHVLSRGDAATFVVKVAPEDIDKFLGQNARTSNSLQIIVSAVGTKAQRRFSLTFQENPSADEREIEMLPEITGT